MGSRVRVPDTAEAKLSLIAQVEEIVGLGFFDWDVVTGEMRWSDGMYRIYGIHPGRPLSLEEALAPVDLGEERVDVRRLILAGLHEDGSAGFEVRLRRPDGDLRTTSVHLQATTGAGGALLRVVGTMLDVTRQRRSEAEVETERRRAERLAQSLRAAKLQARALEPAGPEAAALSAREREVLALIAGGLTSEEIAEALHITRHTARTHARNILEKLGARTRAHAVALALGSPPD